MSFWHDLARFGGAAVGGAGGFLAGGPGGAAAGAGLGYQLGNALVPDNSGEDEANQIAALYDNLKYQDPSSNPDYAANLKLLQTYAKGTLTPEDRAREYEALGSAQNFAAGESGAIAQDAAARGGGGAGVNSVKEQVAAQGSARRLGSADVAIAGQASQRALQAQAEFARQMQLNSEMQNQFALMKAQGQAAGIKNVEDIKEREAAAQNANMGALANTVGGWGLGKLSPAGSAAPVTSAGIASIPNPSLPNSGFTSTDGFGGFKSSLPAPTTTADFGSAPTTADAAAQAYAASLPFAQMPAPGSAPSTSSDDPRKRGGY